MHTDKFVTAWKKGIRIVGEEFFKIKASSLDKAEKKWQLEPNYFFIQENIWTYSHGKQVLMGMMYSFFDSEDGQKILEKAKTPNFVQALNVLDEQAREIVYQLCQHQAGWL
ncbi:MAG: hypothetical protein Q8R83_02205 [Legionellaceae bacterium]|nr:hypothetical protein [Legionellaceae bacterium]